MADRWTSVGPPPPGGVAGILARIGTRPPWPAGRARDATAGRIFDAAPECYTRRVSATGESREGAERAERLSGGLLGALSRSLSPAFGAPLDA